MPIIGMLGSWMLPIPGASSGMLSRQGLLPFGYLVHLRGAPLHTVAPGGNCMLNTHGVQFTASCVRATLLLHDGFVSAKFLGTPAPYTGQRALHAAPTEDPQA